MIPQGFQRSVNGRNHCESMIHSLINNILHVSVSNVEMPRKSTRVKSVCCRRNEHACLFLSLNDTFPDKTNILLTICLDIGLRGRC